MLSALLAILAGLILLIWSADRFVDGSIGLAENFGMSKAMIGLTIVALGTSAPEILVSIMSALSSAPNLAFGNAVGSNIANIGLVLGVTALIASLPVKKGLIRQDLPALLAVTGLVALLLMDYQLTAADSLILAGTLGALFFLMIRYKQEHADELINEDTAEALPDLSTTRSTSLFVIGLTLLILASKILVWGAVEVARALSVSELVIGLTIVALGTSLPELAASVASALRKQHDIALGNIVGSNILNLLAVLAAAAAIDPITIDRITYMRDYGSLSAITLLLALFILWPKKNRTLSTTEGIFLLLSYLGYLAYLYQSSISS